MRKSISFVLVTAFISTSLYIPKAQAGEVVMPVMPKPGTMVALSPKFEPAHLQGIVIHPDNALQFDFLIHKGDGQLNDEQKRLEYNKLIKYFLASLTVPDQDQWVNLSPYEKNRIIQDDFGKTEMGRDLLAQDYLLKQITSSLMYPETGLGKNFWDNVYARAQETLGKTNIPVNTFNKVWIVPSEAVIHENGNTAFIVKSHLKVLLETDYLALNKQEVSKSILRSSERKYRNEAGLPQNEQVNKAIRDIILPELEREVNEGKNFAQLRQVFSGMILATWYKQALKESLLGKVYADKAKVKGTEYTSSVIPAKGRIDRHSQLLAGIQKNGPPIKTFGGDIDDVNVIYQQYLEAFKKGVYDYIKEDKDKYTNQPIPRKYFAGGVQGLPQGLLNRAMISDLAMRTDMQPMAKDLDAARVDLTPGDRAPDAAMVELKDGTKVPAELYQQIEQKLAPLHRLILYYLRGLEVNKVSTEEVSIKHKEPRAAMALITDGHVDWLRSLGDADTVLLAVKVIKQGIKIGDNGITRWVSPVKSSDAAMTNKGVPEQIRKARSIVAGRSYFPKTSVNATSTGGIDLNAANMDLVIKRDGKGVPLPLAQQDMAQLSRIEGFFPRIIEIRPAMSLPIFNSFLNKTSFSAPN